jgi:isocitrate dehydrogenase
MTFTPTDGSAPQSYEIFNFEGRGGVGLAMYNTLASIEGFAKVLTTLKLMWGRRRMRLSLVR